MPILLIYLIKYFLAKTIKFIIILLFYSSDLKSNSISLTAIGW